MFNLLISKQTRDAEREVEDLSENSICCRLIGNMSFFKEVRELLMVAYES